MHLKQGERRALRQRVPQPSPVLDRDTTIGHLEQKKAPHG